LAKDPNNGQPVAPEGKSPIRGINQKKPKTTKV
jgi:hypothetical protein